MISITRTKELLLTPYVSPIEKDNIVRLGRLYNEGHELRKGDTMMKMVHVSRVVTDPITPDIQRFRIHTDKIPQWTTINKIIKKHLGIGFSSEDRDIYMNQHARPSIYNITTGLKHLIILAIQPMKINYKTGNGLHGTLSVQAEHLVIIKPNTHIETHEASVLFYFEIHPLTKSWNDYMDIEILDSIYVD